MSNAPIGNEEQMAQIKALIDAREKADEVNLGDKAKDIVEIDYTAEETGKNYKGKIVFKRPNVMETLKMGGRKSQILKDAGIVDMELADDGVLMMAQAMSVLEIVVVKCPEWFIDMEKLEDSDLIFHIYGKYRAWNYSFRLDGAGVQA
jgi:hypothetical protein